MMALLLLIQDEAQTKAVMAQLERACVLHVEKYGAAPASLAALVEKKILMTDAVPDGFTYAAGEGDFTLKSAFNSVTVPLKGIGRRDWSDDERLGAMTAEAIRAYHLMHKKLPDAAATLAKTPGILVAADALKRVTIKFGKDGARISIAAEAQAPLNEKDAAALAGHIKDLDSDDFATREEALAKITALGPPALEPVRKASGESRDPEVSARLKQAERALTAQIKGPTYATFAFLSGNIARNERTASMCLKSIVTAQENFKCNDLDRNNVGDYWAGDVAGLYCMQVNATGNAVAALNDIGTASADARPLAVEFKNDFVTYNKDLLSEHWPKAGYVFEAMTTDYMGNAYAQDTGDGPAVHSFGTWGVVAYPAEYGVTGRFTFITNEGASVFRRDTGGRPVLTFPTAAQLSAEWAKVE